MTASLPSLLEPDQVATPHTVLNNKRSKEDNSLVAEAQGEAK